MSRMIFVLGMHRSGTSLTTNVLNELGVAISDDLIPPSRENVRGYFESQTIATLQDDILKVFGTAWNAPNSFRALPPQWWKAPAAAPYRNALTRYVASELDQHPIWAFKDPRTMRMMPLWMEIVAELGAEPSFLLATRNPNEVAGSLYARGKTDPAIAELLWLEHNVDALLACRERIAAIVDYQGWFEQPVSQARDIIERLALPYEGDDEQLGAMLARVIAPELRHHVPAKNFQLPFTGPLYQALVKSDRSSALQLAELFNASRALMNAVTSALYTKFNELVAIANQQQQRIADLEAQLRERA